MRHRDHNKRLFHVIVAAMLAFAGCAPQMHRPSRICPGKESVVEALDFLKLRSQDAVSFKASGQCLFQYYVEGKLHKENFPVKLWVSPPVKIRLQGDVAFNPKGIVLGSNEREFWLSMKPKEISSYWWGRWSEENCFEKLMLNPKVALEALGALEVGVGKRGWSLSKQSSFDILTRQNKKGKVTQKIYVDSCDYLVRRIEYFDVSGRMIIVVELDRYKQVLEDLYIPSLIKIVNYSKNDLEDLIRMTISLKSIKSTELTEKAQRRLFSRPEPRGFKHIYRFNENCDIIEQPQ